MTEIYKPSRKILFFMFGTVFLNIMDLYTTYVMLSLGGVEINPLFSHLNTNQIDPATLLFKIATPLILCLIIYLTLWKSKIEKSKLGTTIGWSALIFLFLINLCTVTNNIIHTSYQLQEIEKLIHIQG